MTTDTLNPAAERHSLYDGLLPFDPDTDLTIADLHARGEAMLEEDAVFHESVTPPVAATFQLGEESAAFLAGRAGTDRFQLIGDVLLVDDSQETLAEYILRKFGDQLPDFLAYDAARFAVQAYADFERRGGDAQSGRLTISSSSPQYLHTHRDTGLRYFWKSGEPGTIGHVGRYRKEHAAGYLTDAAGHPMQGVADISLLPGFVYLYDNSFVHDAGELNHPVSAIGLHVRDEPTPEHFLAKDIEAGYLPPPE